MKRGAKRPPKGAIKACQDESTQEPETDRWSLLLPMLMEMVIDKLDFEKDRRSILNMRGVHPHWNEVVEGVLERRRVLALSKWAPFHERWERVDIYQEKYCPLFIPKVEVVSFNPSMEGIGAEARNGFTRALYLCPKGEERMTRARRGQVSLPVAAASLNQNLSSVVLHGIQYSPRQLQQFLNGVPQLKTLEILQTTVMLKECQNFEEEWPLPSLPTLTKLTVRGNGSDAVYRKFEKKYQVPRWLTKSYTQLKHLEVDNARLVDPWKLEKMEHLKVHGLANIPSGQQVAASASLVRLSILEPEPNQIAFADLVSFIQKCSEKLEHLHLDMSLADFKDIVWDRTARRRRFGAAITPKLPELHVGNQVIFPQLKTFALRFHESYGTYWSVVEYLFQQFPALEQLQLIRSGKGAFCGCCAVKMEAESKRIWELCSNLNTIRLYEMREENSFWKSVENGAEVNNWKIFDDDDEGNDEGDHEFDFFDED